MKIRTTFLSIATLLAIAACASAQGTGNVIPFQGQLADQAGNPLSPSNAVTVVFRLYRAPVGGVPIWEESQPNISVNAGRFSVLLGSRTELPGVTNFNSTLYLGLTVDDGDPATADVEMRPRQALVPVISASYAKEALKLAGYDWSVLFGTNNPASGTFLDSKIRDASISGAKLLPLTITSNQIAAQTITAAQIAPATIAAAQIARGTISSNEIANGAVITAIIADDSVTSPKIADGAVTSEKIKDGTITQAHIARIALPPPDYDSGWFDVNSARTYQKNLGFQGLPSLVVAYYKLSTGEIFAWGLNQYGDDLQANGIVLDFDEVGNLYVRAPSGNSGNNALIHLATYRNRMDNGNTAYNSINSLSFRVKVWK